MKLRLTLSRTLGRAVSAYKVGKFAEAEEICEQIVAAKPNSFDALHLLAIVQSRLGRRDAALANYDRALGVRPDDAEALYNRGKTLTKVERYDEAAASYDRALAVQPDWPEALNNRGTALTKLKRHNEALASYDRALGLRPDWVEALNNRGTTLTKLNRLEEALASYERVLAVRPDAHAISGVASCVFKLCQFSGWKRLAEELDAHVSGERSIVTPFVLVRFSGDPELQLQCARNYTGYKFPSLPNPLWNGETWRHEKLRVAYLSADFHQHATAYLMAELFERHDRSRFEIHAVSFGPDDRSTMRKRLIAAFDRFDDVRSHSDQEIARRLHDLEVDIAIDLKGYTHNSRTGIFAHRPAPIQVSYLGYPGTMGAEFIDYIIADKVVAPPEHQPFYTESIVHLPDCYQVNDSKRAVSKRTPTRQEVGLPEQGFVFCCFNQNSKITPVVFEVWIRLLHRIESSVLWLLLDNEGAATNLRKEAEARGIDPTRLVFAGRLPLDQHLARQRLADLFLDTLPYNAHTAASDALWVGLPVLTCKGETFAARVAASLLYAVGLPELITSDLEEYEALALKLATEPAFLEKIRRKLIENRRGAPLFDTDRFRRNIEAAYTEMWEIWQRGEAPHGFAVQSPAELKGRRQPRRQRVSLRARVT